MRTESDFLGSVSIDHSALYGIHSIRAKNNFPDTTRFDIDWFKSMGLVKKACYITANQFFREVENKYKGESFSFRIIEGKILELLAESANEVSRGEFFDHFIVPAVSGGAGTSINMNVNEIIANLTLIKLNKKPGDYNVIDTIEHANIFQSTNDVVPTALHVAVLGLLIKLEEAINLLRIDIEKIEKGHLSSLRIGYTQMQEAVPTSYGRLFSNYNDALSRDWWRVSKCFERIKVVNLGGSAIGNGITVPRFFIMEVVKNLQQITGLPVTRGENLTDTTSNLDSFVEIHGILKSHAVNLEKMTGDLRLLSSDIAGIKEIEIPDKQTGSSIMPGKVNPVIPEFVISSCHKIYSNDLLVSTLCAQGCLELNAYLPVIGHAILESLKLLIACNETLKINLFKGIKINSDIASQRLMNSPSITTALVPFIGYNKAAEIAKLMKLEKCSVFEANKTFGYINESKLKSILSTDNLLSQGFKISDII